MHRLAKELLTEKLKEIEKQNNISCKFKELYWNKNYGVFSELPFYDNSDIYYFESSYSIINFNGYDDNNIDKRGENCLYWIDKSKNGKILFVPDICIFHQGRPSIIIEVVHTNPVSQRKIEIMNNFFNGNHYELYEVEASDILNSLTSELEKVKMKKIKYDNNI